MFKLVCHKCHDVYTVRCKVYTVHSTLYTVHFTLTVHCKYLDNYLDLLRCLGGRSHHDQHVVKGLNDIGYYTILTVEATQKTYVRIRTGLARTIFKCIL